MINGFGEVRNQRPRIISIIGEGRNGRKEGKRLTCQIP